MNILNQYFDKIFVITCHDFIERQNYIKEHFNKNNISFEFYISTDKKLFVNDSLSNSERSLINSHLNCVKTANIRGYNRILICEDDVNFIDNLEGLFKDFIDIVPNDWYYLQLGNQFWAKHWLRRRFVKQNLYKFEWGTGSHCIAINSSAYEMSIKRMEFFDTAVDTIYYDLFQKNGCYCPDQFLADALSKNDHLGYHDPKFIFISTILHKK